tara:strand:+ start:934 stop:2199 length:1266 start_codon:yes stop_codon:yes gene_type:complete
MQSVTKIGIIQFPGSNTERETMMACRRASLEPVPFLWNDNPSKLSEMSGFIIIGGFSYEDRSRAGIIAALDPIMDQIKIQSREGKPVLGICNGAQILAEKGMIPGLKNDQIGIALTNNKRIKNGEVVGVGYYNTWSNLMMSVSSKRCAFTRHLKTGDIIRIPLAHGEGRFIMAEPLLNEMVKNEQGVYRYCDGSGEITDQFPVNPNGSIHNLAAVCNPQGNVMAMMPHPERTKDGDMIFSSMKEYIEENNPTTNHQLKHQEKKLRLKELVLDKRNTQWVINMIITDNEASSVRNALRQLGYEVSITRQTHWEITIGENKEQSLNKIDASGELYNSNKEYIGSLEQCENTISILVRLKEDMNERLKQESLKNRFQIKDLIKLKRGVIWNLSLKGGNISDVIKDILETNILFNPLSHEYYRIS